METVEQDIVVLHLKEKFGDDILSVDNPYSLLTMTVAPSRIVEVIRFLYDHKDLQFQYLTTLCGIHFLEASQIAVMYQLHSFVSNKRLRLKIFLPAENPVTPTITHIFAAANWLERETYDFYGVHFDGHPDLRRILNVEDMIIFPMRKEYPLEDQSREDKRDDMFGR